MRCNIWNQFQTMVILAALVMFSVGCMKESKGQSSPPAATKANVTRDPKMDQSKEWIASKSDKGIELQFRSDWEPVSIPSGLRLRTKDPKETEILVTVREGDRLDATEVLYADDVDQDSLVATTRRAEGLMSQRLIVHNSRNLLRIDTPQQIIFGALQSIGSQGEQSVLITVRLPKDAPALTVRDARHILAATHAGPAPIDPRFVGVWAAPVAAFAGPDTRYVVFRPDGTFYDVDTIERYDIEALRRREPFDVESGVEWKLLEAAPSLMMPGETRQDPPAVAGFFEDIMAGEWRVVDGKLSMQITHRMLEPISEQQAIHNVEFQENVEGFNYQNLDFHRIGLERGDKAGN